MRSVKQIFIFFTARHFITRALLSAENFVQAQQILRDNGAGAADGCSINMTFIKLVDFYSNFQYSNFFYKKSQEGDRVFHNAEMGPAVKPNENESQLNILTVSRGECIMHCNKYLRLKVPEVTGLIIDSSIDRMDTFHSIGSPKTKEDVINMLGDTKRGKEHQVFRDQAGQEEFLKTICVGIFDIKEKTWSLYKDNPKTNEPLAVLPLLLKKPKI